ncbi:hypothetical protein Tco_0367952 [Tanacetum coccineum]
MLLSASRAANASVTPLSISALSWALVTDVVVVVVAGDALVVLFFRAISLKSPSSELGLRSGGRFEVRSWLRRGSVTRANIYTAGSPRGNVPSVDRVFNELGVTRERIWDKKTKNKPKKNKTRHENERA